MANLYELKVTKEELQGLSEHELKIVICGGKILNELNVTTTLLMFSINSVNKNEHPVEKTAAMVLTMTMMRALAGHVFEGKKFFSKWVRLAAMSARPAEPEFDALLAELNTYFGRANIISELRNKASFHTDVPLMQQAFEDAPAGFVYDLIISDYPGQSIYMGSEMLIGQALPLMNKGMDWEDSINAAFLETTKIAQVLSGIIRRLISAIITKHLHKALADFTQYELTGGLAFDQVTIPYFFSSPPETE